jgi:putative oxidoreductase
MQFFYAIRNFLDRLWFFVPLIYRLVLARGFMVPFFAKFNDIHAVISSFEKINIPVPHLSAYLVMMIEGIGAILLFFGLFTRLISIPLFIIMIVALETVHGGFFEPWQTGWEVPLCYALLLLALIFGGAGVISLDHLFFKKNHE